MTSIESGIAITGNQGVRKGVVSSYINPYPINIFAVTASTYEWAMPGWNISAIGNSGLLANNRIVAGPILITRPRTITGAGLNVTTAGASGQQIRIGIYTLDERGFPRFLVADLGVVSVDTTGIKILELGGTVELQPGRYATVMVSNDSAGQLSRINVFSNSPIEPLYSNPANTVLLLGLYTNTGVAGAFEALPSEIPTSQGWLFVSTSPQTSSVWLRMIKESA